MTPVSTQDRAGVSETLTPQQAKAEELRTREPDPRLAAMSDKALHEELRRRRLTKPGRDINASRTSATGRLAETTEMVAMARRAIRSARRRIGGSDLAAFGELARLRTDLDQALGEAAWELHLAGECDWREIGAALGIAKQTAWRKFARYRPAGAAGEDKPE
jgi:hypothetical protein